MDDFQRDGDFVDSTKHAFVEIILVGTVLISNSDSKPLETKFRYLGLSNPIAYVYFSYRNALFSSF